MNKQEVIPLAGLPPVCLRFGAWYLCFVVVDAFILFMAEKCFLRCPISA